MTAEQQDKLHDLYLTARNAWGTACNLPTSNHQQAAYAANKAFTDYLYSIGATP